MKDRSVITKLLRELIDELSLKENLDLLGKEDPPPPPPPAAAAAEKSESATDKGEA